MITKETRLSVSDSVLEVRLSFVVTRQTKHLLLLYSARNRLKTITCQSIDNHLGSVPSSRVNSAVNIPFNLRLCKLFII